MVKRSHSPIHPNTPSTKELEEIKIELMEKRNKKPEDHAQFKAVSIQLEKIYAYEAKMEEADEPALEVDDKDYLIVDDNSEEVILM